MSDQWKQTDPVIRPDCQSNQIAHLIWVEPGGFSGWLKDEVMTTATNTIPFSQVNFTDHTPRVADFKPRLNAFATEIHPRQNQPKPSP